MTQHTEKLEGLLYAQAMNLAEQHLERGRQASEQIRQELQARLQQLQEGEEQRFQHEAEQRCRQMLQTSKLRLDMEMDRLRWALVQGVLADVRKHLESLPENPEKYHLVLESYLAEAAAAIPEGDLVVELNPRDIERLKPVWSGLVARAASGRKVAVAPLSEHAIGGLAVRTEDGLVRVNNTFEGRLARMQDELLSTIMEKLFKQENEAA